MNNKKHNHGRSIGVFLVILGVFLGLVMMDVLSLGSTHDYFVWPVLVIFIGVVSFFNGDATAGIIIVAVGGYFLFPRIDYELPELVEKLYWPAAIILAGMVMIISGIIRRYR